MNENRDLVVEECSFLFVFNGADVHLLEVAHNHHLPLVLVLRDASVGRAPESILVEILMILLRLRLDEQFIVIICFGDQLKQFASSLLEDVVCRFVENLRPQYRRPVL